MKGSETGVSEIQSGRKHCEVRGVSAKGYCCEVAEDGTWRTTDWISEIVLSRPF